MSFILEDATITINTRVVSDDANAVDLDVAVAGVTPVTAFAADWAEFSSEGRIIWDATIAFHQDFGVNEIDGFMWPLIGKEVDLAIRADSGSVNAGNPQYEGKAILLSWPPFGNAVGELATATAVFRGTGELVRRTI